MLKLHIILLLVVASLSLFSYSQAAVIGTASIHAPAVILTNNTGSLTEITLTITNGNGKVNVAVPKNVGYSMLQSATVAAAYASNFTGHNFNNYNFTYSVLYAGDNVSGPSAGAAMTILAISIFDNRSIRPNLTMTGTISGDGSIGEIGGVYDKVAAAKSSGMKLVLVPKVSVNSGEDELYLLVQTNFGIPLVQVANISQAEVFAFNSSITGLQNQTSFQFYTDYNVSSLPNATIECTSSCNYTIFDQLLNATFNLTRGEIDSLGSNPKFSSIANEMGRVLNQSVAISGHGYAYTAADMAFLNYVNAFYFNGYPSNRTSALSLLSNIQGFCSSLSPPPLTTENYNYVLNAELRQLWGNYTIHQAISAYNTSQIESDQILDELYVGAQSNGWCTAANLVYNEAAHSGSTYVTTDSSLRSIAYQRLQRAAPYQVLLYTVTAQQAYNSSNFAVSILDSDYAYAIGKASQQSSILSTGTMLNMSRAMAANATFGVWATEFAKESQFYARASMQATNQTDANSYAISAYSSALLAQQISNDSAMISNNLLMSTQQPGSAQMQNQTNEEERLLGYVALDQDLIIAMLAIIMILLVINIVFINIKIKHNLESRVNNRRRKK